MRDGTGAAERDVKAPGRAQASCRGMSGMDAAKAVRARDGPSRRAPGTAPESREVRRTPVCRNGFAYFPRKESRSPVRGETLKPSHRDNGYVPNIRVTRHAERGNHQSSNGAVQKRANKKGHPKVTLNIQAEKKRLFTPPQQGACRRSVRYWHLRRSRLPTRLPVQSMHAADGCSGRVPT